MTIRIEPKGKKTTGSDRARRAAHMREVRLRERDIRPHFKHGFDATTGCPLPANPRRRKRYATDLVGFLRYYFPDAFDKPFSDGHKDEIKAMQATILDGGLLAYCSPRGDGKTSRAERTALWSILYGYHQFVIPVGADFGKAQQILDAIKTELKGNDRLAEDFPEACIPARVAQGQPHKASAMVWDTTPLGFSWLADAVQFPAIPGSPSAGAILEPTGLTAAIRGMKRALPDGRQIRPSLFLLDDCQTDESANSPAQCATRERLINAAVLGSAGPGQTVSAFMLATVIKKGDLADRFLDPQLHPEWHGRRRSLVEKWPDAHDTLWKRYAEIRRDCQRENRSTKPATDFYKQHRKQMDAGAIVDWKHRKEKGELSALQHAQNLRIDRGEAAFMSEYQNTPIALTSSQYEITEEVILSRNSGLPRLACTAETEAIVAGVDINYIGLNWIVVAATRAGVSHAVAHGKHPHNDVLVEKNATEAVARQAIGRAIAELAQGMNQTVIMADGKPRHIDIMAVDCGNWTEAVFAACNAIRLPMKVTPVRGRDAKSYRIQRGSPKTGTGWHLAVWERFGRVIVIDADFWREATQRAFLAEPGTPGSISMYDTNGPDHVELAREICAETLAEHVQTAIGHYYKWNRTPGVPNDKLDALTYAHAMTSYMGAGTTGEQPRRSSGPARVLVSRPSQNWRPRR